MNHHVQQPSAAESNLRMRLHVFERGAHRPLARKRIRIEQNHIAAARLRKPAIVRGGKAQIYLAANQLDLAKIAEHDVDPSSDALSTTIISCDMPSASRVTVPRHSRSNSRVLYETITTERSGRELPPESPMASRS